MGRVMEQTIGVEGIQSPVISLLRDHLLQV